LFHQGSFMQHKNFLCKKETLHLRKVTVCTL
jgi:hypothetical protein